MTKTELKQIIKEEIQGYSKYLGKTKGLTSDELTQILTKIAKGEPSKPLSDIKENEEKEYEVEYWYRWGDNEKDYERIKTKASSEEEAIEKAKFKARRGAISSTFEIIK